MRKITLITLMLFTALSYAQVGINTNTPNASSALDIESTTGGILIPRLTEIQRDAIVSPASGLMIYQTDEVSGFYFYNGTGWTKIDGVAGPAGPQGPAGPAGPQGLAGADGEDGAQGPAGVQGPQGDQGIQGDTGAQGPVGSAGVDGVDGAQGPAGPQGLAGADGEDGAQGPVGSVGPTGSQGLQGPAGPAGADGADGADGAKGPIGPAGNQGVQGPVGADSTVPGPIGPIGPAGPQGNQGAPGPAGVDGQDGVDGAQGVQGDQGIQGETGTQGPIGPTGSIGAAGAPGAQGPVGPSGESFQANNAYVVAYSDISSIEGLSDGDLVFDITKQNLYVYTSSSETVSSTYVNFLSTPTSSSTSNTYNVSYIISFQVAKRISIGKIPKSDGGNYASAAPYIFEDNDNINDGFGAKIYSYISTNEYPDLILSPGKTYRILYIGYSNSFTTRTSNIGNYSFDSSLFLNLQTHKTEDILSSSIPSNYNVEETSTIPYFDNNTDHKGIFSYHGVSNFILIN